MNSFVALVRKICPIVAMVVVFLLFANVAAAAEEGNTWRSTFDRIMVLVNFLILVAIIYKFGKAPIKEFLTNRQFDVANEIEQLEKQKTELQEKTEETLRNIEDGRSHFADISEKIIAVGERTKQSIIEDAKNQSQVMIEEAKRKIEAQISSARQNFREELIDSAINLAMNNIKGHMTPQDDQRLVDQYLSSIPDQKP